MKSFVSVAVLLSFLILAGLAFAEEVKPFGGACAGSSYRNGC